MAALSQDFSVKPGRGQVIAGIVWFLFYTFLLGLLIPAVLSIAGMQINAALVNGIYFIIGFLGTVLLLFPFLSRSIDGLVSEPLRVIKAILLSYIIYEVFLVGFQLLLQVVYPSFYTPNDETVTAVASENYGLMWAGAVLLGPVTEETLVRGLIFGSLREKSRPAGYVISALIFAAMHIYQYLGDMLPADILVNIIIYGFPGMVFCFCYEYAGTIWAPIILHMILNAISMQAIS